MSALASAALLLPILTAYAALRRPRQGMPAPMSRAAAASLAPSLGLGFASCLSFFLLVAELPRPVILRVDVAVWLAALLLLAADAWRRRGRSTSGEEPSRRGDGAGGVAAMTRTDRIALIAVAAGALVLFALVARTAWVHASLRPHGEWDAWAIWNLRARAILRGAPDWMSVLSSHLAWSNIDYPLLLPLSVARLWAFDGTETPLIPALVAATFFASTVATVSVLVGQARGWVSGLLSGAMLVAPHTYVFQGTCQCADVPLAQFVLIAVACAAMTRVAGDNRTTMAAAGAAAGLAAWTKNEGQMFLLLMVIGLALWPARHRGRTLAWFGLGAAAPLAALLWFKLRLAPQNYLFTPTALAGVADRLLDAGRWTLIWNQLTSLLPAWGDIPGGALLILAGVVTVTARVNRAGLRQCAFGLSVIGAMTIGYLLVYAITPLPLEWQILTSFARLVTQMWPALVWALFQLSMVGSEDRPVASVS